VGGGWCKIQTGHLAIGDERMSDPSDGN